MPKRKCYILANEKYGLYYGELADDDFDPVTRVARVTHCRHVCAWFGKTGGITSLAQSGICGSSASEARIGEPCESAILTGIVNIFECSPEAIRTIEAVTASAT
jgi:hypothetical protein